MKLTFLLFSLIFLNYFSFSQEWTNPTTVYYGGTNSYPDCTIDQNGNIHCIWTHVITDNHAVIYYSKSMNSGETWSQPKNISLNADKVMGYAHIVADTFNNLYVSYDFNVGGYPATKIFYQKYDGLTWSTPLSVSGEMPGAEYNYMVIDNDNRVYFFWNYINPIAQFHYRYLESNGIWSDILNPFEGLNVYSFFYQGVVDDQNTMHVICNYLNYNQGSNQANLIYLTNENNIWSNNIQISYSEDNPIRSANISLSSINSPGFVWQQKMSNSSLYVNSTFFTELDGIIPFPSTIVSENSTYAAFSYDYGNNPHIILVEKTSDSSLYLVYYKNLNSIWEKEILEENSELYHSPTLLLGDSSIFLLYCKVDTLKYAVNKNHTMILMRRHDLPILGQRILQGPKVKVFPNPFTIDVYITLENLLSSCIELNIYSVNGKCVYQIKKEGCPLEKYVVVWNGKDKYGNNLPHGLYYIQLISRNRYSLSKIVKQ